MPTPPLDPSTLLPLLGKSVRVVTCLPRPDLGEGKHGFLVHEGTLIDLPKPVRQGQYTTRYNYLWLGRTDAEGHRRSEHIAEPLLVSVQPLKRTYVRRQPLPTLPDEPSTFQVLPKRLPKQPSRRTRTKRMAP